MKRKHTITVLPSKLQYIQYCQVTVQVYSTVQYSTDTSSTSSVRTRSWSCVSALGERMAPDCETAAAAAGLSCPSCTSCANCVGVNAASSGRRTCCCCCCCASHAFSCAPIGCPAPCCPAASAWSAWSDCNVWKSSASPTHKLVNTSTVIVCNIQSLVLISNSKWI